MHNFNAGYLSYLINCVHVILIVIRLMITDIYLIPRGSCSKYSHMPVTHNACLYALGFERTFGPTRLSLSVAISLNVDLQQYHIFVLSHYHYVKYIFDLIVR